MAVHAAKTQDLIEISLSCNENLEMLHDLVEEKIKDKVKDKAEDNESSEKEKS